MFGPIKNRYVTIFVTSHWTIPIRQLIVRVLKFDYSNCLKLLKFKKILFFFTGKVYFVFDCIYANINYFYLKSNYLIFFHLNVS